MRCLCRWGDKKRVRQPAKQARAFAPLCRCQKQGSQQGDDLERSVYLRLALVRELAGFSRLLLLRYTLGLLRYQRVRLHSLSRSSLNELVMLRNPRLRLKLPHEKLPRRTPVPRVQPSQLLVLMNP